MTTVLLLDDQSLQRLGMRMLIEAQPDLTVVGEAGDDAEAVRETVRLRPDVVLMDVRAPGADGIETIRRIAQCPGDSRVLILATFDLHTYAHAALRAGASGFLLKDARPEELIAGIHAVAAGD
ncbi:response regulator, partial [Streptomyces sp. SID5914]